MATDRSYYVYILYHEDGITPFYVGKGKGRRWLNHEERVKPGKSIKDDIIFSMKARGLVVPKKKIANKLTNSEAISLEIQLIIFFGRNCDGGILANIINDPNKGGMFGRKHSEETREKMRQAALGREISEKQKEAARKFHKGRKASEETLEKRSISLKRAWEKRERLLSPEHKSKLSDAKRGKKLTAEHRAKLVKAQRARRIKEKVEYYGN